ncbi:hypothetical protein NLM27_24955 [Bradyrhizobium sp. CCGB12]|uniref:hypothetical protein n=1 Tax=Bradyrhizobium sp. CCGB12 TaxID=2949632 RepID=UPI0020B42FD1|nr:hypothetical protein [Bradyrhizobium sp. CCGB12]MCP3392044.1 hypothetical protein [Bradyrhizobium sp. CCGB12]
MHEPVGLKWLRMMDYASLIPALIDLSAGGYEKFMGQFYMAIMNGDNKAAVDYEQARSGGSWFEENRARVSLSLYTTLRHRLL